MNAPQPLQVDGALVLATLNEIIDPCSAAAGSPAGLVDMGLLRHIDIRHGPEGAHISVTIGVTEPGCMMGFPFAKQAGESLRALAGVCDVDVRLDCAADWTPSDMSSAYRERLARERLERRRIVATHEGVGILTRSVDSSAGLG